MPYTCLLPSQAAADPSSHWCKALTQSGNQNTSSSESKSGCTNRDEQYPSWNNREQKVLVWLTQLH